MKNKDFMYLMLALIFLMLGLIIAGNSSPEMW